MNRTQTKCFFVSAAVHALLVVVIFVGSAFVPEKKKVVNITPFKVFKVTDDMTSGGGNPNAVAPPEPVIPAAPVQQVAPPPVQQEAPKPVVKQPEPAPVKQPEPVKQPVEKPKPVVKTPPPEPRVTKAPVNLNPDALRPKPEVKKPEKPKIVADLSTVKKTDVEKEREREKKQMEARARVEAAAKAERERQQREYQQAIRDATEKAQRDARERAEMLGNVTSTLANRTSGNTMIEMPGPGGEAFVNYSEAIYTIYYEAWMTPPERSADRSVRVQIEVAKSGRVISARIISRSGDGVVDNSVQTTINRVKSLPAFPPSAKEERRTFNITFNLKAKRHFG